MRSALVALLVALAAAGVGAAAREHRPVPFGDTVTVHSTAPHSTAGALANALRRGPEGSVQLYSTLDGSRVWTYRRPGSVPVRLLPLAAGTTVAVWDDGMLTGIRTDGPPEAPAIRWHRFVPGLAGWLARAAAARTDPGPLLAPLRAGTVLLVPTPELVLTLDSADGAIRTDTLAPAGCGYDPSGALARQDLVVLARPCGRRSTVEGFGADGRRWQVPAGPQSLPAGWRGLDPTTGRPLPGDRAPFPR